MKPYTKHTFFFSPFILLMIFTPCIKSTMITAEIASGELIDKITILEIKAERIADKQKLLNIMHELETLAATRDEHIKVNAELNVLIDQLRHANTLLWEIEDMIRAFENKKDFGEQFITLARGVYFTNDLRCAIKRRINEITHSSITEEKSYQDYAA